MEVDFASTVIPRSHLLSAPFSTVVQKQFSRYFNEFEELQLLGKGAFGAVIKVMNPSVLRNHGFFRETFYIIGILAVMMGFYFSLYFCVHGLLCICRSKISWTAATMPLNGSR